MKRVVGLVLVLAMLGWTAVPARAVIGTIDVVPGATLLAPYFEVDLSNPSGVNTLIAINNASVNAVVVQVVLYSDLSVPTMGFNLYLTGYDVQTISLRNLFNGVVPQTADVARDPADTISPKGPFSQDITVTACGGQLPPSTIPPDFPAHLAAAHTGQASTFLGNRCAGQNLGDNIARGYVIVNVLNQCTALFPNDPGYFGPGGTGHAGNQNVLWGDIIYVDDANNFAQASPLVHIEADATNPETSVPGQYTFFGRYVAWNAADNREPLATNFAVRFLNGGAFGGGTDLLVWRDSKVNQGAFDCPVIPGVRPAWYPLVQEGIVVFDEQEQPDVPEFPPFGPPIPGLELVPFPAEANRTAVGGPDLPVPFQFGWLYLNLNTTVTRGRQQPPGGPSGGAGVGVGGAQRRGTVQRRSQRDPAGQRLERETLRAAAW